MADRYRVLNGNWNLADSWSASSGGAGGASVPTSADNVFFDVNTPTGTHTVNVVANCLNFNCTGFGGTLAGNQALNVYGNFTLAPTMTVTYNGNLTFYGNCAFTTNGTQIFYIRIMNGATLTLQDKLTSKASSTSQGIIVETGGAFVHNDSEVEFVHWTQMLQGNITFKNLTKSFTPGLIIFNGNILVEGNLYIQGGGIEVRQSFQINGNFTCPSNPNDPSSRTPFYTHWGTSTNCTVTCNGIVNISAFDIWRINAAGTASWDLTGAVGECGDGGGNTGFTFLPAKNCYWVQSSAEEVPWGNTTNWKTTSGGSTRINSKYPLLHDTAVFDANSFAVAGCGITMAWTPRICQMDWTNATNNPTIKFSGAVQLFGDLILPSTMQVGAGTQQIQFFTNRDCVINTFGKTIFSNIYLHSVGKKVTLLSDLTTTGWVGAVRGILDMNDFNINSVGIQLNGGNAEVILFMRSGTWTSSGGGFMQSFTQNIGTGTLKLVGNFQLQTSNLNLYRMIYGEDSAIYIRGSGMQWDNFIIEAGVTVTTYNTNVVKVKSLTTTATPAKPVSITGQGFTALEGGPQTVSNFYLKNSVTSPANTFFAKKSINDGGNTNWTFVTGWQHKVNGIVPEKVNGINFADIGAVNDVEV
jgi:hypothetical protein